MPTEDQLVRVGWAWSTVFERRDECEALLLANGCRAFLPFQEFWLQFAERPEDVELHKIYGRETARRPAIPSSLMFRQPKEMQDRWWRPPRYEEGRLALAKQAGFDSVDAWVAAENPSPLQLDPDPVRRSARARLGLLDGKFEARNWYGSVAMERARTALALEAERCQGSPDMPFLPEHRHHAAREASNRVLTHLGFRLARTKLRNYVAFDLDVSDDLVLRWSVGDRRPNFIIGHSNFCRPELHLRERNCTKRAIDVDTPTHCFEITYDFLVEGLRSGYNQCCNEREMNAIFFAQSLVVGWLLPFLLKALQENIPGIAA